MKRLVESEGLPAGERLELVARLMLDMRCVGGGGCVGGAGLLTGPLALLPWFGCRFFPSPDQPTPTNRPTTPHSPRPNPIITPPSSRPHHHAPCAAPSCSAARAKCGSRPAASPARSAGPSRRTRRAWTRSPVSRRRTWRCAPARTTGTCGMRCRR